MYGKPGLERDDDNVRTSKKMKDVRREAFCLVSSSSRGEKLGWEGRSAKGRERGKEVEEEEEHGLHIPSVPLHYFTHRTVPYRTVPTSPATTYIP
jgi:hypothetical protein